MIEQFVGSIKNHFYNVNPVKVYDEQLPSDIVVPSMYFPPPFVLVLDDTKQWYKNSYTMNVQVIDKGTHQALQVADKIVGEFNRNKKRLPLVNEQGVQTGDYIYFTSVELNIMETGIVQVKLEWEYQFYYENEE